MEGEVLQRAEPNPVAGRQAAVLTVAAIVDSLRGQGEPVAMVLAESPYLAEDGVAKVDVVYETLDAVVDPELSARDDAPRLHHDLTSNVISERYFCYGEPAAALAC